MLKKYCSTLTLLLAAYILGFCTRGFLLRSSDDLPAPEPEETVQAKPVEPQAEEQVEPPTETGPIVPVEPSHVPATDEVIPVDVPYDPANPVKRLQALEKVRYQVPGSAFSRLVETVFDTSDHISASVSALMELSIEESDTFNDILYNTIGQIRAIEAKAAYDRIEPNGDVTLVIPPFAESGALIRSQMLDRIESELGADRRYIFEMMLIQKPSSFGNFGNEPMAVRNPEFETVNGWRQIVTIDIGKIVDAGTEDERFEGVRKAYKPDAFEKRFGHFFILDTNPAAP